MWPACLTKKLLTDLLEKALKDKELKNMHRMEDNIKMQFNEQEEGQGGLHSSLWLGTMWWAPVNMVIRLDSMNCREFLC
jgi:hypothetical protein